MRPQGDRSGEIARGFCGVQITDAASGLRPGLSQQACSVMKFVRVSEAAPGAVETIISPSWDDVHVVVPDVLVAVGLVVLTRGNAVAAECRLHGDGRRANGSLNWRPELDWEVVDVFVVIVRDDQHRTWVPRPPLRVHLHKDEFVAMNKLEREVRRPCCQIPTEGTLVARKLVVVHAVIFVDRPRAYEPRGSPLVSKSAPATATMQCSAWAAVRRVWSRQARVIECRLWRASTGTLESVRWTKMGRCR